MRLLAILLFPALVFAQSANPVMDAFRQTLERASKNLVGAAEEMPADKYAYKPTSDQMSFADIVEHTAGANYGLCARISGKAAPEREKLSAEMGKDKLVAALTDSFQFCQQALADTADAALSDEIVLFGERKGSKAAGVLILAGGWGNHYAHAADYLRLNGVLPPTAKPEE